MRKRICFFAMTRGSRIKRARLAIGMSPSELARKCAVGPTTLWKWESDRMKQLTGDNLCSLAEALGVPAHWIERDGPTPHHIIEFEATTKVATTSSDAEVQP